MSKITAYTCDTCRAQLVGDKLPKGWIRICGDHFLNKPQVNIKMGLGEGKVHKLQNIYGYDFCSFECLTTMLQGK